MVLCVKGKNILPWYSLVECNLVCSRVKLIDVYTTVVCSVVSFILVMCTGSAVYWGVRWDGGKQHP